MKRGELKGRVDGPPSNSLPPSRLVPERYALVHEAHLELEQYETVKLLEAAALEGVADDGDTREVGIREHAEACEGEVLVRVSTASLVVAQGNVGGWEKACGAREAQVRFAFKCCEVRAGVTAGK